MSYDIESLKIFIRVARTGSFSRAGREAGLSQSSVSRIIAALEKDIGAGLFTRTTRAVMLTEKGEDYLARVEPIVDALDEANHAVRGTGEIRGTLRIGVPASIAVREVIPRLPAFLSAHPRLSIDLRMEDRYQDLIRDGVDVAIRFGALSDSSATSRLIADNPRLLAASPAYLAKAGMPASPAELTDHAIIVGPTGSSAMGWTFERDGKSLTVHVEPYLKASLNDGAVAAAVAGLGIVSGGFWGCRRELADGSLVRILEDWQLPRGEVHAVYPAGRTAKIAARLFIDYLAKELRRRDDP
jgi:DNA-binding transcriptional LysR family regulator